MTIRCRKTVFILSTAACCSAAALWFVFLMPGARAGKVLKAYGLLSDRKELIITAPLHSAVFPPELPPTVFRWKDRNPHSSSWLVSIRFSEGRRPINVFVDEPSWTPSPVEWESIKKSSRESSTRLTVIGLDRSRVTAGAEIEFTTSKDSICDPLFYREVILPFSEAVKDPSRINWRFGPVSSMTQPPVVLEKLPVCGNCHSFSFDGSVLGMDVDYANDKGSYAVKEVRPDMELTPADIITWNDYMRDNRVPTFGLLSQVSPDGRHVVSTVKDRSVFVARPDLSFSQLFFPLQGILAVYSRETGGFSSLRGADDPALVQSNPSWSPDGRFIVFARSKAYKLKNLRNSANVLLSPEECSEFLTGRTQFKYDLYRVPFNDGRGGTAEPLRGASGDGMSNFFARYSPDGRWIVFCKAESFMLLQPDSKLFIMPAEGGEARTMRCNTGRMNSWHTWSSNSRWLVFASKRDSPYTQLFITHIDSNGLDAPAVPLERMTRPGRAANIPEFVHAPPGAIASIKERFIDDVSLWRAGKAFEEAGDLENAEKKYAEALALNPKNGKAHVSLGNALEKKGLIDSALVHYRSAVRFDTLSAEANINVGNIYYNKGSLDEAARHFRAALRLDPDNGYAHYNLGQVYFTSGRYRNALSSFSRALDNLHGYSHALTRFAAGKACSRLNRREEAIAYFTKGVELLPQDPDGHHLLARELVKAGRMREAISRYRTGLTFVPESAELRFHLANLLRYRGISDEAVKLYEEALRFKPDLKEAGDSLAAIHKEKTRHP